jgi:hypothetical protein
MYYSVTLWQMLSEVPLKEWVYFLWHVLQLKKSCNYVPFCSQQSKLYLIWILYTGTEQEIYLRIIWSPFKNKEHKYPQNKRRRKQIWYIPSMSDSRYVWIIFIFERIRDGLLKYNTISSPSLNEVQLTINHKNSVCIK